MASIVVLLLGTQWYMLFNVIAGAMAIPTDLKECCSVFRLQGIERWKKLILPGIFPYLVTGMVTASGGAWNASIVAEYFHFKGHIYTTTGLGATISQATDSGDFDLLLAATIDDGGHRGHGEPAGLAQAFVLAETRYPAGNLRTVTAQWSVSVLATVLALTLVAWFGRMQDWAASLSASSRCIPRAARSVLLINCCMRSKSWRSSLRMWAESCWAKADKLSADMPRASA